MDDSTQDTRVERGPGAGAPKRFGRFETVSLLGRGGMGAVYLCRVSIDGRHAGFTPLTQALEPGRHQFNCEWPGQGMRSFEADITPQSRRLRFQR